MEGLIFVPFQNLESECMRPPIDFCSITVPHQRDVRSWLKFKSGIYQRPQHPMTRTTVYASLDNWVVQQGGPRKGNSVIRWNARNQVFSRFERIRRTLGVPTVP